MSEASWLESQEEHQDLGMLPVFGRGLCRVSHLPWRTSFSHQSKDRTRRWCTMPQGGRSLLEQRGVEIGKDRSTGHLQPGPLSSGPALLHMTRVCPLLLLSALYVSVPCCELFLFSCLEKGGGNNLRS